MPKIYNRFSVALGSRLAFSVKERAKRVGSLVGENDKYMTFDDASRFVHAASGSVFGTIPMTDSAGSFFCLFLGLTNCT